MSADPRPKIPSDERFGKRVAEAREGRGWNQEQLASRVGTSQPTISAIERGSPSQWIPEVCRILKIPGPMFGFAQSQEDWSVLGHELEEASPATFMMAMGMIQKLLEEHRAKGPPPSPPPPPRGGKRLRPVGSANLTGLPSGDAEVRRGDELPGETKSKR